MKKKFISLLLAVVMVLSLAPASAFAATAEATQAANELHALGLFGGTGTDANGNPIFDLDRAPTRQEAITVLVGLLGKTEEAKSGKWNMPFTDVDNWAKPFVGYAYANGIASGTSATTFGAKDTVTVSQYLSFMLRVQGYESGKDFHWNKAWELSDQIGLTDGRYDENTKKFLRSDVVIISLQAYKMMEVLKTAPDWGLPADIKFIAEPKTDADLQNNILYKFLFGEYSLDFTNYTTKQVTFYTLVKNIRDNVDAVADTYTAIAGPFNNAHVGCGADDNGMFIDFPEASLTPEQIYEQQLIAMETAKAVQASLWEQGKITDSMSEKEIAQAYHDYLTKLRVKPGDIDAANPGGRTVEFDSVYAALINKKADCVGRAAAFNLFMHLEGISAQGVTGHTKGAASYDGHIISRVVLDGEEYFCDWGNGHPLEKDVSHWMDLDAISLEAARTAK